MIGVGLGALDPSDLSVLDLTSLLVLCFLVILDNYCKIRLFSRVFLYQTEIKFEQFLG